MKNLPISRRILIAFGFTLLFLVTVAVTGGLATSHLTSSVADFTGRRLSLFDAGNELIVSVLQSARHTRNMLILDEDKVAAEMASDRAQRENRVPYLTLFRQGVLSPEGKHLVAEIDEATASYNGPDERYLKLIEVHQKDAARSYLLDVMRPAQHGKTPAMNIRRESSSSSHFLPLFDVRRAQAQPHDHAPPF